MGSNFSNILFSWGNIPPALSFLSSYCLLLDYTLLRVFLINYCQIFWLTLICRPWVSRCVCHCFWNRCKAGEGCAKGGKGSTTGGWTDRLIICRGDSFFCFKIWQPLFSDRFKAFKAKTESSKRISSIHFR